MDHVSEAHFENITAIRLRIMFRGEYSFEGHQILAKWSPSFLCRRLTFETIIISDSAEINIVLYRNYTYKKDQRPRPPNLPSRP